MLPNPVTRSDPIGTRFYDPLEQASSFSDWLFYAGAVLSCATPFLNKEDCPLLYDFVMIAFALVVIALFVVGLAVRLYFTPRAEDARRKDFLASACGIPLAHENTVGYYNNDVTKPTERIAAQILENSHFTKSGALCLLKKERTKMVVYFVIWLICIFNRQVDLGLIVAASQAVFSEQVISKWVRLEWLRNRTERVFESVYQLFQTRPNSATFNAMAFDAMAQYESTKANAAISLSSKIFHANNAKWTAEWEEIKAKLKINAKP